MNKIEILNLLAAHADALNEGVDKPRPKVPTPETLATVLPLFVVAEALKAVLVPVRPREAFKIDLAQQLRQTSLTTPPPKRRRVWLGAAAVGSLLSLAGLILLLFRYSRPHDNQSQPATTAV